MLMLLQLCISDLIEKIQINVAIFPLNVMIIGQWVMKWQQFFQILDGGLDGGSRHLEKYTACWATITRNEFLVCNLQSKM